jgi:hypothetical protein
VERLRYGKLTGQEHFDIRAGGDVSAEQKVGNATADNQRIWDSNEAFIMLHLNRIIKKSIPYVSRANTTSGRRAIHFD